MSRRSGDGTIWEPRLRWRGCQRASVRKFNIELSWARAGLSAITLNCERKRRISQFYSDLPQEREKGARSLLVFMVIIRCARKHHTYRVSRLVEAVVGIAVISIGAACAVGALTKFNSLASTARNATGAYTAVMNQIDLIQSDSPFNPQKTNPDGTAQIPPELQLGTHTQNNVSVYQDPKTGVIVTGTMTTTVTDISSNLHEWLRHVSAHNVPSRGHDQLHLSQPKLLIHYEHNPHIRHMKLSSNKSRLHFNRIRNRLFGLQHRWDRIVFAAERQFGSWSEECRHEHRPSTGSDCHGANATRPSLRSFVAVSCE